MDDKDLTKWPLAKWRQSYHYTQQTLARLVGMSQETVARLESGTYQLTTLQRYAFADVFHILPTQIISNDQPMQQPPAKHLPVRSLIQWRQMRHLSQKQLAAKLGISHSRISDWECYGDIDLLRRHALAKALDIRLCQLADNNDEHNKEDKNDN